MYHATLQRTSEVSTTSKAISWSVFILLAVYFVVFNTVFYPGKLPTLVLPGGLDLHISDILIGSMLAIGVFRRLKRSGPIAKTPISKYVLLLISVLLVVVLYSIFILRQPITTTFANFRSFYGYLLFFPAIWALGNDVGVRAIVRLWTWLVVFGVIFYIVQFFHGEFSIMKNVEFLYSTSREVGVGGDSGLGGPRYTRLFSAGTVLFRIMLFVSICMWLFTSGRQRWWWGALAALIGFQVLLQFTRGMYLTTVAVLMILPFLIDDAFARRRLLRLLGVIFFFSGIFFIYKLSIQTGGGDEGLLAFVKERFLSVFGGLDEDKSVQARFQAWDYYKQQLSGHWLLGIGLGVSIVYGDSSYLSFLIKSGVMGLTAFLLLYGVVVVRGFFAYKGITDLYMKAVYLGLWLSTLRHLVNGITQSDFAIGPRIPALIISVAIMEIILYNSTNELKTTPRAQELRTEPPDRRILTRKHIVRQI